MRKLATVDTILKLNPIPNADAIEVATVRGWHVVVKKNEFKVGDLCVYCEVDSNLPLDNPHFAFLANKATGKSRFRVRTIRLRGQISQGIVFPVSILNTEVNQGDDVTELLGIEKYEPPISASLAGNVKGNFPGFITKTDEERVQNLVNDIKQFNNIPLYVTEKLDGTSATFYYNNGDFGVCSRNYELKEDDQNTYWMVAKKLLLKEILQEAGNYAIQGEIIGPGIQKNRLKRNEIEFYVFRVTNLDTGEYLDLNEMKEFCKEHGLNMVPVITESFKIETKSVDELLAFATTNSSLTPGVMCEGYVFRTVEHSPYFSFKAINPKYLLKYEE